MVSSEQFRPIMTGLLWMTPCREGVSWVSSVVRGGGENGFRYDRF
jgi:hypothetical protein